MKNKKSEIGIAIVAKPEEQDSGYGEYGEDQIEEAANILLKAEEIKSDKAMMKYVKECMQRKVKKIGGVISSMDDLKSAIKEKMNDDDDEEY